MSEKEYDKTALIKNIQLSVQGRDFYYSDLGQFIIERSRSEAKTALLELKNVDPHDFKKIQEIQFRIKVAESFEDWLKEAIQLGDNSRQVYDALEAMEAGDGGFQEEQEEQTATEDPYEQ